MSNRKHPCAYENRILSPHVFRPHVCCPISVLKVGQGAEENVDARATVIVSCINCCVLDYQFMESVAGMPRSILGGVVVSHDVPLIAHAF